MEHEKVQEMMSSMGRLEQVRNPMASVLFVAGLGFIHSNRFLSRAREPLRCG